MEIATSPLVLALAATALGSALLVWHRHGGPRWMFAVGGFFFVLSRVAMLAICAVILSAIALVVHDEERALFGFVFAALVLAIGAWSAVVLVRVVLRDAFGKAREPEARQRL
jgi:hypothetical protein